MIRKPDTAPMVINSGTFACSLWAIARLSFATPRYVFEALSRPASGAAKRFGTPGTRSAAGRSAAAAGEPAGLLGDVRVPQQHVLAERDVAPEEDEREEPFAQVVVMLGRHAVGEVAQPLE